MTESDLQPWPRRVVVTGASGHLGGWIVSILASAGIRVTAAAGPADDAEQVASRLRAVGVAADRLRVVPADLMADARWDDIMAGQDALLHVAAPMPISLPESCPVLLAQARDGTRRVLRAAAAAGIRRVVATSSIMAASYDSSRPRGHVLTESDWSVESEPMTAYALAKTAAERAAWRVADELGLGLTMINPGVLLGPGLTSAISPSLHFFGEVLAGRATVAPRILLPLADVRDVAWLHVAALASDATIGERIFAVADQLWLRDLILDVRRLDPRLGTLPEPRPIDDELARRLADAFSMLRYLRYDIGEGRPIDRSKAARLVGLRFRPIDETLRETIAYFRSREAERMVA